MDEEQGRRSGYLSFLLRLWHVTAAGMPVWRASLQRPGTSRQQPFAGLEELLAFLYAETGQEGEGQMKQAEQCKPETQHDKASPAQ